MVGTQCLPHSYKSDIGNSVKYFHRNKLLHQKSCLTRLVVLNVLYNIHHKNLLWYLSKKGMYFGKIYASENSMSASTCTTSVNKFWEPPELLSLWSVK